MFSQDEKELPGTSSDVTPIISFMSPAPFSCPTPQPVRLYLCLVSVVGITGGNRSPVESQRGGQEGYGVEVKDESCIKVMTFSC